jgi:uncharacterized protein YutE (UPF0331/DUF86 family)
MVSRDVILIRINKLREYMTFLDTIKNYSKEEYTSNPMIYASTERFLHLSIECILDIGNHIISDLRYRKPENNKDIFEVLYENKLIEHDLKENLCKMAQFRNILVHDYIKLDREIVYEIVTNNIKDLKTFIDVITEYI